MSRGSASVEAIFCGLLFAGLILTSSVAARRFIDAARSYSAASLSTQENLVKAATPCLENIDTQGEDEDVLGRKIKVTTRPICK